MTRAEGFHHFIVDDRLVLAPVAVSEISPSETNEVRTLMAQSGNLRDAPQIRRPPTPKHGILSVLHNQLTSINSGVDNCIPDLSKEA